MTPLLVILVTGIIVSAFIFRFYISSVLTYLSVRLQRREKDLTALSSLRESLVHERKKKMAGLEMIISTQTGGHPPGWETGEVIQQRSEYFDELVGQLMSLVREERRDLMAVTRDIFLWGRLWSTLRRVEKIPKQKREKLDFPKARRDLARIQNLIDDVLEEATEKFSFTLNQVAEESVKIVRIEKSQVKDIEIKEQLDQAGDSIRFSYHRFKDWQRLLTNLIRNAVEAVEAKQSGGAGVAVPSLAGRGGAESHKVVVSTEEAGSGLVSVIIEDSGIGMDEATRSSFFKKGFTSGKEHGLGLGVTEESIQFVEQYGNWHIESKKGVGTRITISLEKDKAREAELILPEARRLSRKKIGVILSTAVFALVALVVLIILSRGKASNPATIEVENKTIAVIKNKAGEVLWRRALSREILLRSSLITDVNGDGRNEVLIGVSYASDRSGELLCFSHRQHQLWGFSPGRAKVFGVNSPLYMPAQILVRDVDNDGETEIVLLSINQPLFPCQIAVLDGDGKVEDEYWHSGHAAIHICADIDDDGGLELLCGAVNNRLDYSAAVFMLDGDNIRGQSPPYADGSLPKAREQVYLKVPYIIGLGGENQKFSYVEELTYMGQRQGTDVYRVLVGDPYGIQREYHLDANLDVKGFVFPTHTNWHRLRQEGTVHYDVTPEVIESWKQIEVWRNGVKVR